MGALQVYNAHNTVTNFSILQVEGFLDVLLTVTFYWAEFGQDIRLLGLHMICQSNSIHSLHQHIEMNN